MKNKRVLVWDGCTNVRDLGGLRTCDNRLTRWKTIVRSDSPARLTSAGWSALYAYGIRTIITLCTFGMVEDELKISPRYSDIATVRVEIEDITDMEFVKLWVDANLWSTPLYYQDALQRWPERHATAISAIAMAQPGGVLFHCIRGNDRTGIIAILLLALAGVEPEDIVNDYELSQDSHRDEFLKSQHTSSREVIMELLATLDVEDYLFAGGLSKTNLEAVRERFLCPIETNL